MTRINRGLLVAALGYAMAIETQKPRRSAEVVWDELMKALAEDNGCVFKPTEDQKERALPHLRRMVMHGRFQEEKITLNGDIWQMAAGETFEKLHRFMGVDGYLELDLILEDVFNGAIER